MDAAHPSLSAQTLLEHERFVRAVARGLLGDAHAAEDVAQDAWVRALQRAPGAGSLRAWLGTVTKNLVHDARRRAERRAEREERAARVEAQESVDTAFERLSVQRDVVEAILGLGEPYRSVVLLRYYHELEPSAIAARLGAKPATVRTQLVRAHELLRAKLDARYRRDNWAALLLPRGVALAKSGIHSVTAITLTTAAALAVVLIWGVAEVSSGRASPDVRVAVQDGPSAVSVPSEIVPAPRLDTERVEAVVPVRAAEPQARKLAGETLFARAELFDQVVHGADKAFFSFQHGLRDDPGHRVTDSDWELAFQRNEFGVITCVDDHSRIVDLGSVHLAQLSGLGSLPDVERVPVLLGHSYFVWTRDYDTDMAAAFEVVELVPGDRCVLEWYAAKLGGAAQGSFRDESGGLAEKLLAMRCALRERNPLRGPHVVLQVRGGAGGNPNRIDMAGECWKYIYQVSPRPLDLITPIDTREKSVAYFEGGFIPEDKVFVVTRVRYSGIQREDSRRDGEFKVVLQGETIYDSESIEGEQETEPLIDGRWIGRVEIRPGDEVLTYLEVANSSGGEVVFDGEFIDRERLPEAK